MNHSKAVDNELHLPQLERQPFEPQYPCLLQ